MLALEGGTFGDCIFAYPAAVVFVLLVNPAPPPYWGTKLLTSHAPDGL